MLVYNKIIPVTEQTDTDSSSSSIECYAMSDINMLKF